MSMKEVVMSASTWLLGAELRENIHVHLSNRLCTNRRSSLDIKTAMQMNYSVFYLGYFGFVEQAVSYDAIDVNL